MIYTLDEIMQRASNDSAYSDINEYSMFFFSSRRRHTRFDCDWSSDVCSSDLERTGVEYPLAILADCDARVQQQPDRHRLTHAAVVRHLSRDLYVAIWLLLDPVQRLPARAVAGVGQRDARHRHGPGGRRPPPGERAAHAAACGAVHRVRDHRDHRRHS